jgi:transposase
MENREILEKLISLRRELTKAEQQLDPKTLSEGITTQESEIRSRVNQVLQGLPNVDIGRLGDACGELQKKKRKLAELQAEVDELKNAFAAHEDALFGGPPVK